MRDGWLVMERDEADRRMRKVHASARLVLLFGEYQRFLLELLSDSDTQHLPLSDSADFNPAD